MFGTIVIVLFTFTFFADQNVSATNYMMNKYYETFYLYRFNEKRIISKMTKQIENDLETKVAYQILC
jgi:hypothetical protein